VDFVDFSYFAQYWLETDCGPCNCDRADFTRNGCVDVDDLLELTDNWLAGKDSLSNSIQYQNAAGISLAAFFYGKNITAGRFRDVFIILTGECFPVHYPY